MIDLSSKKASQVLSPPIVALYGGPGIGKTAFGVGCDSSNNYLIGKSNHILMNVDFRGGDRLTCHRLFNTPVEGIKGLMEGFKALAEQKHDFSWLCIDDASTLEELFVAEVCKECKVSELGKVEYGKGYELAKMKWFQFFDCIKGLQEERNIGVIILAHSKVEALKDPTTGESFNRFDLQMDKRSKDIIKKSVDLIGFAHKKTYTRTIDAGFGNKENIAVGDAKRIISFAPDVESFESKDRFNMPKEIDLDFSIFEAEISKFFQTMQSAKTNKKEK